MALRSFPALFKIRIRSLRELRLYVARTTGLCVAAALAFDVANQLLFFVGWTAAFRSWFITVAVVVIIAAPVSRAIGKAHLALYRASRTDPLTGLLNRRALLDGIERCPAFVALIIVDIDRFKQVNDTHGHLVGDEVLRAVATLMVACLGGIGQIGRMGGEEFAIVAENTDSRRVRSNLERFRAQVADIPIVAGTTSVSVTISAGLADSKDGQSFEQVYARADRALYLAKASGRNRIVSADEVDAELGFGGALDPDSRADLRAAG